MSVNGDHKRFADEEKFRDLICLLAELPEQVVMIQRPVPRR